MNYQNYLPSTGPSQQKGVSILVTMVMLLVLTLIGVSSMKTATVELKMAGSMQQEGLALNRAEEALRVGETDVDAIIADPTSYDFAAVGDSYYVNADAVADWSQVVTARFWLLIRSECPETGYTDNSTYTLGDINYLTSDSFPRQLYSSVVMLRN